MTKCDYYRHKRLVTQTTRVTINLLAAMVTLFGMTPNVSPQTHGLGTLAGDSAIVTPPTGRIYNPRKAIDYILSRSLKGIAMGWIPDGRETAPLLLKSPPPAAPYIDSHSTACGLLNVSIGSWPLTPWTGYLNHKRSGTDLQGEGCGEYINWRQRISIEFYVSGAFQSLSSRAG